MVRSTGLARTAAMGAMALAACGGAVQSAAPPQPARPAAGPAAAAAAVSPDVAERVRAGLAGARLAFVANTGSLDERVAFWLPGSSAAVYLTDAGLTYRLSGPDREAPAWWCARTSWARRRCARWRPRPPRRW